MSHFSQVLPCPSRNAFLPQNPRSCPMRNSWPRWATPSGSENTSAAARDVLAQAVARTSCCCGIWFPGNGVAPAAAVCAISDIARLHDIRQGERAVFAMSRPPLGPPFRGRQAETCERSAENERHSITPEPDIRYSAGVSERSPLQCPTCHRPPLPVLRRVPRRLPGARF